MALAQRKGWIRLGIVFSVAWIVGVLIYAVSNHYTVRADIVEQVNSPEYSQTPSVVTRWVDRQTFLTDCDVKEKLVSCSPQFSNVALLILLPVVGFWLTGVLIVYTFLWVRAGFRGDKT